MERVGVDEIPSEMGATGGGKQALREVGPPWEVFLESMRPERGLELARDRRQQSTALDCPQETPSHDTIQPAQPTTRRHEVKISLACDASITTKEAIV